MTVSLPRFEKAHLLVIGDIMLDRYWSGPTSRISPEAPVPVVKIGDIDDRLGGAANVALNISTLGCKTTICGVIGSDEPGQRIKNLLAKSSINDATITNTKTPTITKLRVMSRHQQLLRMDFEEPLKGENDQALLASIGDILSSVDAVIISDYAKGTVSNPAKIIELCNKHNTPIFVDPKGGDFQRYKNASFVTPNLSELEEASGSSDSLEKVFEKAEALRADLNLDGLLVTLSEKGMVLISEQAAPYHMPTSAKEVFDVTGAGDTVIATLAAAYASGTDIQTAMRLANLAAGVVVGKLGTSTVSTAELRNAIELDDKDLIRGLVTLEELSIQTRLCKQKGEKIVFTNGCFDILHAGHVRYLKEAAKLGDRLIVGMNSDASISRLKGSQRPIVTLEERMEVISSLNCVDWVVPFEDDTPLELISTILPDTLAKGGDYTAEKIVGHDCVKNNGGETRVLPFVDGCSTTSIIEKIKSLS